MKKKPTKSQDDQVDGWFRVIRGSATSPKDEPTTPQRQAIKTLMDYMRGDCPPDVTDAISVLIDHATKLEQFAEIVRNSMKSAESSIPTYAIMTDSREAK